MINIDNYLKDCSVKAEEAYETINHGKKRISRKEGFMLRYFCYVEWGMPFYDIFNKDYRAANFLAKVLDISYEYTDDYASFGWDRYEAAEDFKRIKKAARRLGYRGTFNVITYSHRVIISLGDVVYSVRNANQVVETMFNIAGYLAGKCVDKEISEFVGSFMTQEYKWMNALSFG